MAEILTLFYVNLNVGFTVMYSIFSIECVLTPFDCKLFREQSLKTSALVNDSSRKYIPEKKLKPISSPFLLVDIDWLTNKQTHIHIQTVTIGGLDVVVVFHRIQHHRHYQPETDRHWLNCCCLDMTQQSSLAAAIKNFNNQLIFFVLNLTNNTILFIIIIFK